MSRKMDKLKVTIIDSGERLTDMQLKEVRNILTNMIVRYIINNKIDIYKKKDIEK